MTARMAWLAGWITLAGILWGSLAAAQPPRGLPKVSAWESPDAARQDCYAILGDISRPGAYSVAAREVTLQDLVQQAGGVPSETTSIAHIIRHGRSAHALLFSPNGRDVLQPRDVVVIDAASHRGSSDAIWLCLVGVIDRPVVVPVRPELAQLTTLVRDMLGQSEDLAKAVRVLPPPRTPSRTPLNAVLPSGTVLVFDPSLIITKNLPNFPETVAMQAPAPPRWDDRERAFSGATMPQSTARAQPGASAALVSQSRDRVEATPIPFPTLTDETTPAQPTSLPAPGSRFYVAPKPAAPPPNTDEPPLDPRMAAEPSAEIFPSAAALGDRSTATSSSSPPVSWWHMLGISGTVAGLIGIAIATRKYLDATDSAKPASTSIVPAASSSNRASEPPRADGQPSAAPRDSAAVEPDDLADLVQGRLPLTTEPVAFPRHVSLQRRREASSVTYRVDLGRSVVPAPHHSPVSAPVQPAIAIDSPVAGVPRPHFQAPLPASPVDPQVPLRRDTDVREGTSDGPRPHIRPFVSHASSKRNEPAGSILVSGTAVERALSQLQSGGPS